MPAEFEPHEGTIMIWPERSGSWNYGARAAREAFLRVIKAIAESEKVFLAVSERSRDSAIEMIFDGNAIQGRIDGSFRWGGDGAADDWRGNVVIFLMETDDAWARDIAPTFVIRDSECVGQERTRQRRGKSARQDRIGQRGGDRVGICWKFNAWGGKVDGLYPHWERDDKFAEGFCRKFGFECEDLAPFVLEGGSIHSDGEGTLMTTEECLLSAGRNPGMTKTEIEKKLLETLGADKVLWLPYGIYGDETNGHVDNICAFLAPGEAVLAWTDDVDDPQYERSLACLKYLSNVTDAQGRKIIVHKLPIPDVPITITQEDLDGFEFEAGEDIRTVGERLAASYVNFYFSNQDLILPVFCGENEDSDRRAARLLQEWCPSRRVIPIPARDILTGGGNIHCITQQLPKGNDIA
ncbi:MAG: agmatine deiminase family protein [Clostridiales bacterium]|nr:agmatine deiminase family protein [Clostridiales bacterium]